MKRFWNDILRPLIEEVNPLSIMEIGADDGVNTRNLLQYCKLKDIRLTSIDPCPSYDLNALTEEFGDHFLPVFDLSLHAIKQCDRADIVLIDGDHNWYTVFHELIEIEKTCAGSFPLVIFHDTAWPYGRRDMYYDVSNMPSEGLQSNRKAGLQFESNELKLIGGFNSHLAHAEKSHTAKNGVLTAIEDFIDKSNIELSLRSIDGLNGLSFLYPSKNSAVVKVVSEFPFYPVLIKLTESERIKTSIKAVENDRLLRSKIVANRDQIAKLTKLAANHNQITKLTTELKAEQRNIKEARRSLKKVNSELERMRKLADSMRISQRCKRLLLLGPKKGLQLIKSNRYPALTQLAYWVKRKLLRVSQTPLASRVLRSGYQRVKWARQIADVPNLGNALQFLESAEPIAKEKFPPVDIIVPVYNAYDYLGPLFDSLIENTDLVYRLIIIDDASPDENVWPLLQEKALQYKNIILLRNERNLGFVKTVNRGLKEAQHDVVIVNSDVVVPKNWLSRLMYPIYTMEKVASATPMSNSSSITSFPNLMQTNELFDGKSLQYIDDAFSLLKSSPDIYIDTPTGHGFCMAMSKLALDTIGKFDEEAFGKGCGEENDWCMRAGLAGFRNVITPNLFCFHNHTTSFSKEEKNRLTQEHKGILLQRYPLYSEEVRKTSSNKYYEGLRLLVLSLLHRKGAARCVVCFTNTYGGGSMFANRDFISSYDGDEVFLINVRTATKQEHYQLEFYYREAKTTLAFDSISGVETVLRQFEVDEVKIHQFFGYLKLNHLLGMIKRLHSKQGFVLNMDVRDFFSICPTVVLLNDHKSYCEASLDMSVCADCISNQGNVSDPSFESIPQWRDMWADFFSEVDEIRVYSDFSKRTFLKVFGHVLEDDKVIVGHIPINYIRPISIPEKEKDDPVNIGIIGNIGVHKGIELLNEMAEILIAEGKSETVRLCFFGKLDKRYEHPLFKQYGEYKRENLPDLMEENSIDVIFIPSIWPETYCRTAQESILMGLPTAVFNLGAPVDRVTEYDKGVVISDIDARNALEDILSLVSSVRNN